MSNRLSHDTAGEAPATRSVVFIDKNGTLVDEIPDNAPPSAVHFRPFAFEAIKSIAAHGHEVVVVTSAPSLGFGVVQRAELYAVEQAIAQRIREETGVLLAGFYTCPHKPGEGGEPACLCRVPSPGLLRQAAASLKLDLERCWVVGDMLNDVEAGRRVGARTVLVDSGRERAWRMSPLRTPHHRVKSLLDAAEAIVNAPTFTSELALEIALPDRASAARQQSARPSRRFLSTGPLRPYEPHPTREWL